MQIQRIAAVLIGGLFLAPASFAQPGPDLAYATPAPRSGLLVVLQSDHALPASALPMVSRAASAAKAGRTVEIVGGAATADIVRRALLREGAPATALVVSREQPQGPTPIDPLDDIASRAVRLRF